MKEYEFLWRAELLDGTVISQYNKDVEVPFTEVEKNIKNLSKFYLSNDSGEEYYVDFVNKQVISPTRIEYVKGDNCKLIHFRRNVVRGELGTGRVLDSRRAYFIGLETDDDKVVLEVKPELLQSKKEVNMEVVNKKSLSTSSRYDLTLETNSFVESKSVRR